MKGTERYVRQATRGLWGRARRELQAELEGHIAERCQEFRLAGLNPQEAERQTLRELGAPVQVRAGMLDVHTVPALGKAGVLSALLATALFSALPQGLAQVRSIYGHTENAGASSYLDFQQLKEAVQKAGGKISGPASEATVTVPGAPRASFPLSTAQWPGTTLIQDGKTFLSLGYKSSKKLDKARPRRSFSKPQIPQCPL
ncbi:permease prefix domain 1-containing protein [Deinococcus frigens]|uniref:permease prefix domain 1-containing protein n=1 Tax=Deinococcus frigens TaxID=249403 RepID=UPI000495CF27|nr:permease prefix domain 1-containing protein [Deinococcus frigens]